VLEEIEKITQADPNCLLIMEMNIREFYDNQQYGDCAIELNKRIEQYGENETTASYKVSLLIQEKKYDDLVAELEHFYTKYPSNSRLVELMYWAKKDVYKDVKAANKIFDVYMKSNFEYSTFIKYAEYLEEQGEHERALAIKHDMTKKFPYSAKGYYSLSQYYYNAKKYDKAEENIKIALSLAPYNETFWEQMGDIQNEKKSQLEAVKAYNLSLQYGSNQEYILNKLLKLNGKTKR